MQTNRTDICFNTALRAFIFSPCKNFRQWWVRVKTIQCTLRHDTATYQTAWGGGCGRTAAQEAAVVCRGQGAVSSPVGGCAAGWRRAGCCGPGCWHLLCCPQKSLWWGCCVLTRWRDKQTVVNNILHPLSACCITSKWNHSPLYILAFQVFWLVGQ